ncbi:MAG: acid phosphatase [Alphaproteobacteria bacterium]
MPLHIRGFASAGARRAAFGLAAALAGFGPAWAQVDDRQLARIEHIVVIYAENRSFNHLYGLFPGANGIANATAAQTIQTDHAGKPLPHLTVWGPGGLPDPRFPAKLPNGPFRIDAPPFSRSLAEILPSPIHAYFHHIEQINGGRNDRFVAMSTVGAWTMGYIDGSVMKLWKWAQDYTLADNFFMAAFGGSYLNHQWLVCACTPEHKAAPEAMRVRLGPDGKLERRPDSPPAEEGAVRVYSGGLGGQVTLDGFSVNTAQPPFQPSGIPPAENGDLALADPKGSKTLGEPLPPQTARTIGDTLSAKGIGWAWYAGGWNAATVDGRRPHGEKRQVIYSREPDSPIFQPHHQPFNYFARFAPGTADREKHLKDGDDFVRDIEAGTLPAVAFYKPVGRVNQHPGYTDILSGDAHIAGLLEKLSKSPQWPRMLVIVTYDENGGYWDHVPPPSGPGWGDRWGPGTRIPAIVVSPFAKRGFVDRTSYDTTSIIKLITRRFGLDALPGVRANAGDLTGALEFR